MCLVANRGRLQARAVDTHDLVGTCVRLYKYLMVSYHEEFVANLREFVNGVEVEAGDPDVDEGCREQQQRAAALQCLYGDGVLPNSALQLYNCGLGRLGRL